MDYSYIIKYENFLEEMEGFQNVTKLTNFWDFSLSMNRRRTDEDKTNIAFNYMSMLTEKDFYGLLSLYSIDIQLGQYEDYVIDLRKRLFNK